MGKKRKILVTAALPYANGDIHIGHLVEYLQTDFWVRYQNMRGHECRYMCADDSHGTPIMISARDQGITPEALITRFHERHLKDFTDFGIEFDNYYSTNSPENRELSEEFYQMMVEKGHIDKRSIKQLYCEHDSMFLPDRFVKGVCPSCGAENQYGDSCDSCSATYLSSDLIDPHCGLCGNSPVERESLHIFFKLNNFRDFLKDWVPAHTSREITNKLNEWLSDDLRDWDISRDEPYFGFKIPGTDNKYFYVWLDAPIGYISSTKNWCDQNNRDFGEFWKDEDSELYHFIGKDIVYFHTLFWPAMLKNAGYKTPDQVFVHGFLTVNGEKMSKSRGTFITARTFLNHIKPIYLRYYYACKLNDSIDDVDLNLDDFILRVNSDLIGKITNLASRSIQMLKKIGLKTGKLSDDGLKLVSRAQEKSEIIAQHFENRNFLKVILEIRNITEDANRYFDKEEPWKIIGNDPEKAREVLGAAINIFRIISIYLKPILPSYVKNVEMLLNEDPYSWDSCKKVLYDHEIKKYKHLVNRLDKEQIEKMVIESKEDEKPAQKEEMMAQQEDISTINFEDFEKIDLRVAEILEAENIEEADKLLRLKINLGTGERTIIAGIKKQYKPEDLVGRLVIVVANLKPRKMKFGTSEGMLLAATSENGEVFILSPDSGAKPGQKVS